jgi:hypothetical protein
MTNPPPSQSTPQPPATPPNLMELFSNEAWVREAARAEEESGDNTGAGYTGIYLREFITDPIYFRQLRLLQAIVLAEFRALLEPFNLGIGIEAAFHCGRQLVLERLNQPSAEIQTQLWAALEAYDASQATILPPSLKTDVKGILRSVLTQEDWHAIAAAAAESIRSQVLESAEVAKAS